MPSRRVFIFSLIVLIKAMPLEAGSRALDLEPIIVSKSASHLINSYSQKEAQIQNFSFGSGIGSLDNLPIDLESRSPKGAIQTDFSLRASSPQGVLMLVDGERVNDPQTAHHNSDIPLTAQDIEKVEVIPGVSSALFGPDAIGGAVNLIVKKPKEKKRVLTMGYGEHYTGLEAFSITDRINDLGLRVSVENNQSSGFHDDTDFKKFTAGFFSCLDLPDGDYKLNFSYQQKEFGAFDFYTPGSNYPSKEWTRTLLLDTGFILEGEGIILKPNFLWRRHYDKFVLDKTGIRSLYLNHHRTDMLVPNIYLNKDFGLLGKAGIGLEYGEDKIKSTNLGKHIRAHESVYTDLNKEFNERLSLGISFRQDDYEGFDPALSGSSTLKYNLNEKDSLSAGFSRSIRVPSFTELYYSDPTTLGDPNLSEERSLTWQTGYARKEEKLSYGAVLFFRQEDDLIDWVKHSSAQAKWQVENVGRAGVPGIEAHCDYRINGNMDLDSYYTYIDKHIDDDGLLYKYGPNYIKHLFNSMFTLKLPFGTQGIGVTYKKKPGRRGWPLFNTRFSYNLKKNCEFYLEITNLLDIKYEEIEGIPQPGRWTQAGVKIEW